MFKKTMTLLVVCSAVLSLFACQSTPNKTETFASTQTKTQSLSGQWAFKIDPYNQGRSEEWWKSSVDTKHWDNIAVPGVWDIYDKYHDYTGTAWYRYQFDVDAFPESHQVQLMFDSVYHDSEVWLNDVYLGANNLGFMAFKFDISEHINTKDKNTLVVKVNNRVKRGAVWNWGGIRFPVYLAIKPKINVEHVHVTATPDLVTGTADLHVKTQINHPATFVDNAKVKIDILRDGQNVYSDISSKIDVSTSNSKVSDFIHTFSLPKEAVALWHFNAPNLYQVRATLLIDNLPYHAFEDRFGIREISLKDQGLYLNGERIRVNGFNMVPEDRFDGNALPLTRIKEDVDLLKMLNGNFARLSGPALPKAYLDYLDEVGFLLIEEVGLWGKDALVDPDHPLPKEWLKRLINDHYNHPSIIGWSVGNEIGDLKKNPKALEYVEGAIAHSKELDPSRMAVYISYSADYQKDDPTQFSDIVMFNKYGDHEERLKVVHDYHPDKAIFFSEIGTKLDGVDPNESTLDPHSLWNGLKKYPYLIGTSHFAFSDYRSDWKDEKPTWTTDWSENRAWGVLTAFRQPKRSFEKIRKFNAPVEDLSIANDKDKQFDIALVPKSTNTFPAFTLRGYQLVWSTYDEEGNIVGAASIALPDIYPGDKTLKYSVSTNHDYAKLKVHLLDPLGYPVTKTEQYKSVPIEPKIDAVFTSLDTVRVSFAKSELAQEYQLRATDAEGNLTEGKATINDFAEVKGLVGDQAYTLSLVALNQAGESKPALREVHTTPDELPPIIWSVVGKSDAFHIGFSVERNDFKYEIEYGLTPGQYTKRFLIDTHGATRVPAIEEGKAHYFRIRRLITGSIDSAWTSEYTVNLLSNKGISPPKQVFAIETDSGLLISLEPAQGAISYRLKWYKDGIEKTHDTKLAYSPFININGFSLKGVENLVIAAIDANQKVGEFTSVRVFISQKAK
ncbi:glycoside hydrolase family 2 protein [Agaribacter flavus]|uniref:Glycoside hydrolase family 2 TIM barrel-domain containing protein n=1 Tax=Agaribacter flavus TaxID=1902781 RepID=A0ABV7FSR4_9ALTE